MSSRIQVFKTPCDSSKWKKYMGIVWKSGTYIFPFEKQEHLWIKKILQNRNFFFLFFWFDFVSLCSTILHFLYFFTFPLKKNFNHSEKCWIYIADIFSMLFYHFIIEHWLEVIEIEINGINMQCCMFNMFNFISEFLFNNSFIFVCE